MRLAAMPRTLVVFSVAWLAACAGTPEPAGTLAAPFPADDVAASEAFIAGDVPSAAARWAPWAVAGVEGRARMGPRVLPWPGWAPPAFVV